MILTYNIKQHFNYYWVVFVINIIITDVFKVYNTRLIYITINDCCRICMTTDFLY